MGASSLRVGPRAIALMHHFEACRLRSYKCPAGVWTIGWGSTGADIGPGLVWTQEQADARFRADVDRFSTGLAVLLGSAPTTPAQFGAMCCLAYNMGLGRRDGDPKKRGFRYTQVYARHMAGDFDGAAAAFGNIVRGGGKVLPGLVRRRAAEAALYRSDFDELARLTGGEVA